MTPPSASAVQRAPSVEFHRIVGADQLLQRVQAIHENIANRANEIARTHGHKRGYEPEEWLQAQSEFLRPVPVEIEELAEILKLRATVLGFEQNELEVSIEPARIVIAGKKERQPEEGNKLFYVDWGPDEICEVVHLPSEIKPALAEIKFHAGVLEFDLLKSEGFPEWTTRIMED